MIGSRLLFSSLFILGAFTLVILSALRLAQPQMLEHGFSKPVFALVNPEASQAARLVASEVVVQNEEGVQYQLPYPGILPDHPLYWLKMLRDRVNLALTKDPLARFELLLLFADKRLGAGEALILGGQSQLGVTTVTKAEKYLVQAHNQFQTLLSSQDIDPTIKEQFAKAFLKHQEVTARLLDKITDDSDRAVLEQTLDLDKSIFDNNLAKFTPILVKPEKQEASPSAVLKEE
ncbi:hypothetical protein GYA49_02510 [Candidatus Beckwithbacteria bacterium]|nr:hypothetical protein [Candidatus Beckwithbacteria bacterium]